MNFRKRPIVVQAFQMTATRRWDNSEWPNWLHQAWNKEPFEPGVMFCNPDPNNNERLYIRTIEGVQIELEWGDWIVHGVVGEIYPCKDHVFKQTCDPVSTEGPFEPPIAPTEMEKGVFNCVYTLLSRVTVDSFPPDSQPLYKYTMAQLDEMRGDT